MRVFRFSIIATTSASETASALVRNACAAFSSVVLSESSLSISANRTDSLWACSAAVRDSASFRRSCAKHVSYCTHSTLNPTDLCLCLTHVPPESLEIRVLMSQLLLSHFQGLLNLSNLVLQLSLLLCKRVLFGLDPPMLMLESCLFSLLLSELESERVNSRNRCWASSETPNELHIACCLSVLGWHTGAAPRKDLPQGKRHAGGDGGGKKDGIQRRGMSTTVLRMPNQTCFQVGPGFPCIQGQVWRTPFSLIKWSVSRQSIFPPTLPSSQP